MEMSGVSRIVASFQCNETEQLLRAESPPGEDPRYLRAVRIAVIVAVVALGCGSKKAPPPATLANLISPATTSVMRTKIDNFPILAIAKQLTDPAQTCWPDLIKKVTAAYQVLLDGDSYFIVEGDLPRADLEKCIPVTFLANPKIRDDDGMLAVESPAGTAYGAWRGNFLVVGTRAQVVAAVGEHEPAWVAKWEALLPTQPSEMAMTSIDLRYAGMMGDDVADWNLMIDKFGANPPVFSGTFTVHYQTPAAATKGLAFIKDWSTRGKFPVKIEADADIVAAFDGFAAAIGKLEPQVSGGELVLAFDSDRLGGPAFFAGVMSHFDKLSGKLPAK